MIHKIINHDTVKICLYHYILRWRMKTKSADKDTIVANCFVVSGQDKGQDQEGQGYGQDQGRGQGKKNTNESKEILNEPEEFRSFLNDTKTERKNRLLLISSLVSASEKTLQYSCYSFMIKTSKDLFHLKYEKIYKYRD